MVLEVFMACGQRNSEKAKDVQRGLQVGRMNLKWASDSTKRETISGMCPQQ